MKVENFLTYFPPPLLVFTLTRESTQKLDSQMMIGTLGQFFRTRNIHIVSIELWFVFLENLQRCHNYHYLRWGHQWFVHYIFGKLSQISCFCKFSFTSKMLVEKFNMHYQLVMPIIWNQYCNAQINSSRKVNYI